MFKFLQLIGVKKEDESKKSEGVYTEPKKPTSKDTEYLKSVDDLIDSLTPTIGNRIPDISALRPPVLRTQDPWEATKYKTAIVDFITAYRNGYFDVCVLNKTLEAFGLTYVDKTRRMEDIHEKLRIIHCKHFNKLDVEIIDQIIPMVNEFFEGVHKAAYPVEQDVFDGEFTREWDHQTQSHQNVYYIEGDVLKERKA